MSHIDTELVKIRSQGRWLDIYASAGITFKGNPNHHQACPHCGGKDRFRMDNRTNMGDYICNHCGSGDGFSLLMKKNGDSFIETVKYVAGVLGISETKKLDPKKLAQIKADNERKEAERNAELARQTKAQHKAKAEYAQNLWASASPATPSQAYLAKKGIQPHGTRVDAQGNLLIPLYHRSGILMNIQTIYTDKKRPITGARKKGCYFMFGTPAEDTTPEVIAIAEGFSTSASIYEAFEDTIPVVMAVDTGNLIPVGEALRKRYGDTVNFMWCADNDINNDTNSGVESANKACMQLGGHVVVPTALPTNEMEQVA